jgi:predicted Zn-dependent protease
MPFFRFLFVAMLIGGVVGWSASAGAHKGASGPEGKQMTAEEAIEDSEAALDSGRYGDAKEHAERLQKTRGLTKEQLRRVDVIVARCALILGKYETSEKIFARLRKASPDEARLSEWYARALDALGKGEQAFGLLSDLAARNALTEGDSYWALAQLERSKGKEKEALDHAEQALKKPIVLQSDELDKEIHKFIEELSANAKKK